MLKGWCLRRGIITGRISNDELEPDASREYLDRPDVNVAMLELLLYFG